MKKIVIIVTVLVLVTFVKIGFETNDLINKFESRQRFSAKNVHFQKLLKDEREKPGAPKTIRIPKIHIDSQIQNVGKDKDGNMDVPTNNIDTGWYRFGFKPGEAGNAVINGHYDTNIGAPAIFYNLVKLDIGDTIDITDNKDRTYMFEVVRKDYFDYNDSNHLYDIFGPSDKPRLNLITCNGVYNPKLGVYSKRLVIFAELKSKISFTSPSVNTNNKLF